MKIPPIMKIKIPLIVMILLIAKNKTSINHKDKNSIVHKNKYSVNQEDKKPLMEKIDDVNGYHT